MAATNVIPGPGSHGFRRGAAKVVRYTAAAQAIHWLTAVLVFAILPIAWHMTMLGRDDPVRETWYTVHKSVGMTILALSVIRIVWRASHPPPALPASMARVEQVLAHASHWALYAVLLAMPISGYVISAAGGHAVSYFGLFEIPALLPPNKDLSQVARAIHVFGQWAVYGLLVLHVAATAWHIAVRRDAVLDRMLPEQRAG